MSKNKNRITAARVQPGMSIRNNKEWVVVSHVAFVGTKTTLHLENGNKFTTVHHAKLQFRAADHPHRPIDRHYTGRMTEVNRADSDNGSDLMRHK